MFGTSFKQLPPPKNVGHIPRATLTLEALEDRTAPAVVFNDSYEFSNEYWGPVSIEVTVTEEQIGGEDVYLWEYAVSNDNFPDIGYFALPALDPNNYGLDGIKLTVGALDTTQSGWMGGIDYDTDRPFFTTDAYIWWEIGNDEIDLGHSGVFSFRTTPTTIGSGTGIVKDAPGIAPVVIGAIAAPVAREPWIVRTKDDVVDDEPLVSIREAVTWVLGNQGKAPDNTVVLDVAGPITLDPGPGKGQIVLGQDGQTKEINIRGPLGTTVTIQRSGGTHRIFHVKPNTTVGLSNLELKNGMVVNQAGGAILSEGNLTIDGCIFAENEATGSLGGAIAVTGGSLVVQGVSRFTGNSAALGGAIHISERRPADISACEFVLNSATGQGGAIYIVSSSNATATPVTLSNVDVNGNLASDRGGGIMVSAAAQGAAGTQLVISSSTVRNNVASATNSKGGGVFFGAGVISLLGVTFQDNEAHSGDGIYYVTGTTLNPFSVYYFINDSWADGSY
jgi:predicted outer membrane repeat protein